MYEHGMEKGGMAMEIMLWKHLTEEQQRNLLLRGLDLKIKKMDMKISMMRDKIRLMEEKMDLMKTTREMLKGGH